MTSAFRIGQGIDVHRLVKGRRLVIGGVEIPYELGLLGHSDADVLCHALMDALLGACGKDDIGILFPDTDAKYKDANSLGLLGSLWGSLKREGWEIGNVDCYLLAQVPRLSPYFAEMKKNIASALQCPESICSIRATTTEGLGAIGRAEGMMANVVVLLVKEGQG